MAFSQSLHHLYPISHLIYFAVPKHFVRLIRTLSVTTLQASRMGLDFFQKRIQRVGYKHHKLHNKQNKMRLIFGCALGRLIIWLRFGQIICFTPLTKIFSKLFGLEEEYRVFLRARAQIACNCRTKLFSCGNLSLGF